jgi:ACR3 family arsenite transporter
LSHRRLPLCRTDWSLPLKRLRDLWVPFSSVLVFIVIPLVAGLLIRRWFIGRRGVEWFERALLPRFAPVSTGALLLTLVFIFAFQSDNLVNKPLHVALIAVPILIQVYFNSSLTYGLMRVFRVEYRVAAPGALIGASNFFELAVATAIACLGQIPAPRWPPSSAC